MRAEVILFDSARAYYWAVTDRYTVVFSINSPMIVRIGDMLEGAIELYGERSVHNMTRDEKLEVFIRGLDRLPRPFKLVA
jgi:hypothetical protein